jgi:hypothetical protein
MLRKRAAVMRHVLGLLAPEHVVPIHHGHLLWCYLACFPQMFWPWWELRNEIRWLTVWFTTRTLQRVLNTVLKSCQRPWLGHGRRVSEIIRPRNRNITGIFTNRTMLQYRRISTVSVTVISFWIFCTLILACIWLRWLFYSFGKGLLGCCVLCMYACHGVHHDVCDWVHRHLDGRTPRLAVWDAR